MGTATHTATQHTEPETPGTRNQDTVPAAPLEDKQARVLDTNGQVYYAVYDPSNRLIKVDALANSLNDGGFIFLNDKGQVTGFTPDPKAAISEDALNDLIAQLGLTRAAAQEQVPSPPPPPSGQADTSTATDLTQAQYLTELAKLTNARQYLTEIDGVTYLATYYPTEQAVKLVPNRENETSKAEIVVYFNVDGEEVTATQKTVDDAGNIVDDSLANPKVADTALATRVLRDLKGLYDSLAGDATTSAPETAQQTAGEAPRTVAELYEVLSGPGAAIPLSVPGASATFDPATKVVVVNRPDEEPVGVYFATSDNGQAVPVTLVVDAATGQLVLDAENKAKTSATSVPPEIAKAIFDQLLAKYAEIKQG